MSLEYPHWVHKNHRTWLKNNLLLIRTITRIPCLFSHNGLDVKVIGLASRSKHPRCRRITQSESQVFAFWHFWLEHVDWSQGPQLPHEKQFSSSSPLTQSRCPSQINWRSIHCALALNPLQLNWFGPQFSLWVGYKQQAVKSSDNYFC